jgi:hypothetical protein
MLAQSGTATSPYLAHSFAVAHKPRLSGKGVARRSVGIIGVGDCPLKRTPQQVPGQADQADAVPRAPSLPKLVVT